MSYPHCSSCRFCEEASPQKVICVNADLADEAGWEAIYFQLGYLELPPCDPQAEPCVWYVPE